MKKHFLLASCIGLAITTAGVQAQMAGGVDHVPPSNTPSIPHPSETAQDRAFVSQASAANLTEVALGQLAQSQGQSDATKQFGMKMVNDHTSANSELTDLVTGLDMPVATAPSPKQNVLIQSMQSMSGADFDKHYARQAVKDHEDAIRLFTAETDYGKDGKLRAYAAQMLPTLKQHLTMAKALPGD